MVLNSNVSYYPKMSYLCYDTQLTNYLKKVYVCYKTNRITEDLNPDLNHSSR